ncbi:MAG: MgtC/SapB family protein [Oscillospiraceae bacterium]|nr:MgtC/SapB family protein [Oscillospiraceae bacterium]
MDILNYLREANTVSVIFRLVIAMILGGSIGLTRNRKGKPAGFRTYMLVCMGAALAMSLGQYLYEYTIFLQTVLDFEVARTDVTRLGAQVINGVGFLGAGTILVTKTKEVQGVTTAAGLWASACMGLAAGAGFYEGVIAGLAFVLFSFLAVEKLENYIIEHSSNMNCYVEFDDFSNVQHIIEKLEENNIRIYDVDFESEGMVADKVRAVFYLSIIGRNHHSDVIRELTKLDCITLVEEI